MLWDDAGHVTRPEMQSLQGLWRTWFDLGSTAQYYPLLHSAFWIEHKLWGDAVLGYHVTNVVLHTLTACLLVLILRRLAAPAAWLAGLIFLLHPVCVESVAWISEQKSTLSGVFYMAAALAYLKYDDTRRRPQYFLALTLFVLALLCKSVTATLPAALMVIFWWQHGRLGWKRDVQPLLPWLAMGAASGLFTAWVEREFVGASGPEFGLSLAQRILLAGRALWFYPAKLIWPVDLNFTYPRWTLDPAVWWQYLFPLGALAAPAILLTLARRWRAPLAGFLFLAGTLVPVLGFLNVYPFIYSFVADHFQYLASLGVIVPLSAGLALAARRLPPAGKPAAIIAALALVVTLGALSWRQSQWYIDADTQYANIIALNPGAWMAHNNLGSDLVDTPGQLDEAINHIQTSLRIRPANALAHNNLGRALAKIPGRLPDALAEYREALGIDPSLAQAHDNLGNALSAAGRISEALLEHQTALKLRPDFAQAHNDLGADLARQGRFAEAVSEFDAALRIEPTYARALNDRGLVLAKMGRLEEAIAGFDAALRVDPNYASAHSNRGGTLLRLGRVPEAIGEFETGTRLEPNSAQAHFNLGFALNKIPSRVEDTIAEYGAAVKINPDFAEAHSNLGGALLRAGHVDQARVEFQEALRLMPDSVQLREMLSRLPGSPRRPN